MRKRYHQYIVLPNSLKMLLLKVILLLGLSTNIFSQVAVIAHPSVPLNEISQSDLFDIYSGETRLWENDEIVFAYDLKPKSDIKESFYNFLGKSPSRMKSIWMVNMLSGEGDPPEPVESEEEMLERVANTPGAIGFLSYAKADSLVKVLQIIEIGK